MIWENAENFFFCSTFDTYQEGIFLHAAIGLDGGLLPRRCNKNILLRQGWVDFDYAQKNQILNLRITASVQNPDSKSSIPVYQQYSLTDFTISTNRISPESIDSVFRVGESKIRDIVSGAPIGTNLFENYAASDNNSGIGISVYTTPNQIFYSMLSLVFDTTVEDPNASVSIRAICPGGQKSMRYVIQARDLSIQTTQGNEYTETIDGISQNIALSNRTLLDCFLTNFKVNIFVLQPTDPRSTVRLGQWDIIDDPTERNVIGTLWFQSYVTSNNRLIGIRVLRFNEVSGFLFAIAVTDI